MADQFCMYIIVGGGLAGSSAVEGIRERDKNGAILLIGAEKHLPYDRPPLSKKLWFGKKKVEEIFLHDQKFYDANGVTVQIGTRVTSVNAKSKTVTCDNGKTHGFKKLLLAMGGVPRTLSIPGGDLEGICYYRYLDDYLRIRKESTEGKSAVVIGGGFIGSEIAAALNINKVDVTMIFPDPYLVNRVFPEYLGRAIRDRYLSRGVKILAGEKPASFLKTRKKGDRFIFRRCYCPIRAEISNAEEAKSSSHVRSILTYGDGTRKINLSPFLFAIMSTWFLSPCLARQQAEWLQAPAVAQEKPSFCFLVHCRAYALGIFFSKRMHLFPSSFFDKQP